MQRLNHALASIKAEFESQEKCRAADQRTMAIAVGRMQTAQDNVTKWHTKVVELAAKNTGLRSIVHALRTRVKNLKNRLATANEKLVVLRGVQADMAKEISRLDDECQSHFAGFGRIPSVSAQTEYDVCEDRQRFSIRFDPLFVAYFRPGTRNFWFDDAVKDRVVREMSHAFTAKVNEEMTALWKQGATNARRHLRR